MNRAFRLAGLLRLRRLEEERAAAELATANAATRTEERERDQLTSRLAVAAFPRQAGESEWLSAAASRAALAGLVNEAQTTVAVATRRAELAGQDWMFARSRVAMLDKLAERHAHAVRIADEAAEQALLDELAARRRKEER
jgi:flagellar protein FliJ